MDVEETKRIIDDKFGTLDGGKHGKEIGEGLKREEAITMAGEVANTVKSSQSWHYPPVVHNWGEEGSEPLPEATPYDLQLQGSFDMDDTTLNTMSEVRIDAPALTPLSHITNNLPLVASLIAAPHPKR